MKLKEKIFQNMIAQGASIWTDVKVTKDEKSSVLSSINNSLHRLASPSEENRVKIEIIRKSIVKIKELHPTFSQDAEHIINQFEKHLELDSIAVLPFRQIDALTFRIFMQESFS